MHFYIDRFWVHRRGTVIHLEVGIDNSEAAGAWLGLRSLNVAIPSVGPCLSPTRSCISSGRGDHRIGRLNIQCEFFSYLLACRSQIEQLVSKGIARPVTN